MFKITVANKLRLEHLGGVHYSYRLNDSNTADHQALLNDSPGLNDSSGMKFSQISIIS